MGFSIGPELWDAPGFLALSEGAQILYVYLLTGPEAALSVPGLVLGGAASIAEARRQPKEHIQCLFAELSAGAWLEVDAAARILSLPRGPLLSPPGNTNVVKGWWRKWRDLPDSPVKIRHLEPLRHVVCEVRRWTSVWHETFGHVESCKRADEGGASNGNGGYLIDSGGQGTLSKAFQVSGEMDDVSETGRGESLSKAFRKPFVSLEPVDATLKPFESLSKGSRSSSTTSTQILDPRSSILNPLQESLSGGQADATAPAPPPTPSTQPTPPPAEAGNVVPLAKGTEPGTAKSQLAAARSLWALQEELIAALPYESIPRDPTDADLRLVALALESYEVPELEYVQRLFASRAEADKSQVTWFNRRANWHPAQIERALRTPIAPGGKGRVRIRGKKRYGGSAFETP